MKAIYRIDNLKQQIANLLQFYQHTRLQAVLKMENERLTCKEYSLLLHNKIHHIRGAIECLELIEQLADGNAVKYPNFIEYELGFHDDEDDLLA